VGGRKEGVHLSTSRAKEKIKRDCRRKKKKEKEKVRGTSPNLPLSEKKKKKERFETRREKRKKISEGERRVQKLDPEEVSLFLPGKGRKGGGFGGTQKKKGWVPYLLSIFFEKGGGGRGLSKTKERKKGEGGGKVCILFLSEGKKRGL